MRIIICGSPSWAYAAAVEDEILKWHRRTRIKKENLLIIHGDEYGPDTVTSKLCQQLGIDQIIYPATKALGISGWFRRNQIMLQEHNIDLVILFDHKIVKGSVVHDMKLRAEQRGIPLCPIDYEALMRRNSTEINSDPLGTGGF